MARHLTTLHHRGSTGDVSVISLRSVDQTAIASCELAVRELDVRADYCLRPDKLAAMSGKRRGRTRKSCGMTPPYVYRYYYLPFNDDHENTRVRPPSTRGCDHRVLARKKRHQEMEIGSAEETKADHF
ncbi:hypothetical protein Bbelb_437960 [Branchiostoma belcheri]|nr:hypothetical protein Bbelb_437960 [Branchiostoma belcheri]